MTMSSMQRRAAPPPTVDLPPYQAKQKIASERGACTRHERQKRTLTMSSMCDLTLATPGRYLFGCPQVLRVVRH